MNKFYAFSLLCFFSYPSLAQNSFKKFYGAASTFEAFIDIEKAPDGFVIGGTSGLTNGNADDFWLIKTDESGNKLWEKTIGGPNNEQLSSIASMPDGGYLLAGKTQGTDQLYDGWLVRVDANGIKIWEKKLDSLYSNAILDALPTPDGGYLLSHEVNSKTSVRKIDSNGIEVWSESLFSANIFIGTDGNYYVLSTESGSEIYKFTPAGALIWVKSISDSGGNKLVLLNGTSIVNGLLVAGINGNARYLSKIDFNGDPIWQVQLSGNSFVNTISEQNSGEIIVSFANSIELISANGVSLDVAAVPNVLPNLSSIMNKSAITSNGNILSAGLIRNSSFGSDGWVTFVSVHDTLSYDWNKTYGDDKPNDNEAGWSVIEDIDGKGFLIGANKYVEGHHNDFYVLKTDENGNVEWEANYGTAAANFLYSATATKDGGYILTGRQANLASVGATAGLDIRKINGQGILVWEKHYAYPGTPFTYAKTLELTDQSLMIVYAAGSPRRLLLMKANTSGDSLWTRIIGVNEQPRGAILNSLGIIEITGFAGFGASGFLIRADLQGNVVSNTLLTGEDGSTYGLLETIDNETLVSGNIGDSRDSIQVTKLNGSGIIDWTSFYNPLQIPGTVYERPILAKSTDGNFILVYTIQNSLNTSQENNKSIGITKIKPDGEMLWEKRLSTGAATKIVYEAILTADGGFALVGTEKNINTDDIFLLKTKADGTLSSTIISKLGNLDLSPNPSQGPLSIRFESEYIGNITLSIFNTRGQLVQEIMESKTSVVFETLHAFPSLPIGTYFVRITTENGRSIARNWIKQ